MKLIAGSMDNIAVVSKKMEKSIKSQREQSSNIFYSMSTIKEITDKSAVFLAEMNEVVKSLEAETRELFLDIHKFKI